MSLLLPNAFVLVAVSALACASDPRRELTRGLYSQSSIRLVASGHDTTLDNESELAASFPSAITINPAHGYDIDIGASRRHGQYRLQHDSVAFFGPRGVFLAGKVFGDTLDLHVVAISREDASQDVAIRFVRSN